MNRSTAIARYSIRYCPANSLHFDCSEEASLPSPWLLIARDFSVDWRAGWFRLAADKLNADEPTVHFWREIAVHFLTLACHLPAEGSSATMELPSRELLEQWLWRAPPMMGGEYLSQERLLALWEALSEWFYSALAEDGGLTSFLDLRAPLWQKVGRVCFHLAENKRDNERPFAFLATYATGLSPDGRLKYLPLKEALQQYAGTNNRQALLKLLIPVQKAAEKCPWVQQLLATAEIYQPMAWSPTRAYQLLRTIPELEESGLVVKIPNWWRQRPRPQVSVKIGSALQPQLGISSLLDFDVRLAIGEEELSEAELEQILATGQPLVSVRGQWVEVDHERLKEALHHWKQVQKVHKNGQLSFIEGMRLLAGAPADFKGKNSQEELDRWVRVVPGAALAEVLQQLRSPTRLPNQIEGLQAQLRPYQQCGVSWLALLTGLGLGACLADDMGLGKTVQILSLLLWRRAQKADSALPTLLIVPASLLGNWQRESTRFTPALQPFFLHPSECKGASLSVLEGDLLERVEAADFVVTTYSMLIRLSWLHQISWGLVILDEAQAIKNGTSQQTKAVKQLKAQARIALTGTPIENSLSDLWSLFDFLNPGLLGSPKHFKDYLAQLQSHPSRFESLRKLTGPYILRRMKSDPTILADLPDKIETIAYCRLTRLQVQYYQAVVDELSRTLQKVEAMQRRGVVLKALLELKQICNHPAQYCGTHDYLPEQSGKFERLRAICEELAARQEKVLLFTQFSEIIAPLAEFLEQIFGRRGLTLHGATPMKQRKESVELFQKSDGPPFFLLSLRAGGTGLTLTEAAHVIHFDRWWNPAVENQATDRAFRIGQKKNVLVHKFMMQGTLEETIDAIIASKKQLANEILSSTDEVKISELADEELLNLISLDINQAMVC